MAIAVLRLTDDLCVELVESSGLSAQREISIEVRVLLRHFFGIDAV